MSPKLNKQKEIFKISQMPKKRFQRLHYLCQYNMTVLTNSFSVILSSYNIRFSLNFWPLNINIGPLSLRFATENISLVNIATSWTSESLKLKLNEVSAVGFQTRHLPHFKLGSSLNRNGHYFTSESISFFYSQLRIQFYYSRVFLLFYVEQTLQIK